MHVCIYIYIHTHIHRETCMYYVQREMYIHTSCIITISSISIFIVVTIMRISRYNIVISSMMISSSSSSSRSSSSSNIVVITISYYQL